MSGTNAESRIDNKNEDASNKKSEPQISDSVRIHDKSSSQRQLANDAAGRIKLLEKRVLETRAALARARANNELLVGKLKEARKKTAALADDVKAAKSPPMTYGTVLKRNETDSTFDVQMANYTYRVSAVLDIFEEVEVGDLVALNGSRVICEREPNILTGPVVKVTELLEDGRCLVTDSTARSSVVMISESVRPEVKANDTVLLNTDWSMVLKVITQAQDVNLFLTESPKVGFSEIGGLEKQIEAIKDAVELPFREPEFFKKYKLHSPKGVLLYGPPGCGKTLIAKAIATSLAEKVAKRKGEEAKSYFISVKGPELLNLWLGESEHNIRRIFEQASNLSSEGWPVVVFFDEMDALFRTRSTSSVFRAQDSMVAQLLAELDGVEPLQNVIVIGATNREDMIDPAVLRSGRLDVKIKIQRPDREAAEAIFLKYLTPDIPIATNCVVELGGGETEKAIRVMVEEACELLFSESPDTAFLEIIYQSGDRETAYFKDFCSGAMIENIVRRAKTSAVKRDIKILEANDADTEASNGGVNLEDLTEAILQEFKENEDLPNTANPDDWIRIAGKKGQRIVAVHPLLVRKEKAQEEPSSNHGQYL